ncbi:hypothetical protein ILYODFUR_024688 [Ilyodon furcidens]|uniref:Uncharacterized protein n=1 Tax=Ilyodon furcidens TaxID=33524 RepID=A0ABV0V5U7_9TELE
MICLCVSNIHSHKDVIKVQAWLDFLSEVYRSKLCPESSQQSLYNAEWSSFPGLKEGQQDCNSARRSACSSARPSKSHPSPLLRSHV